LSTLDSVFWAGGTWNEQGTIVLSKAARGETDATAATLVRVPATGGQPQPVTVIDATKQETGHYWPRFLPDGRHIAFSIGSRDPAHVGVFVTSLDDARARERVLADWSIVSMAAEHMLFVRGNALLAQPFDAAARKPRGEPYAVAEGVEFWRDAGVGIFSASRNGVIVYTPSRPRETQLVWVDRRGERLTTIGSPRLHGQFTLSPDGKRAAVELPDAAGRYDIWIVELSRGVPTRLTFDPADDRDPVWSPDGSRLVFTSPRNGPSALFSKPLSGATSESVLLRSKDDLYPESISPDGKTLLYQSSGAVNQGRVGWMWTLDSHAAPIPIVQTGFRVDEMQISPDGRFLAYASAESGQYEVYVRRFGGGGEKIRVSVNGGGQPKWRRDGRELFFLSEGRLTAVEVGAGPEPTVGLPRPLFDLEEAGEELDDYAPSADGQRFLVKQRAARPGAAPVHVVMNWVRGTD
jgi:Tol biopolymer transport system component